MSDHYIGEIRTVGFSFAPPGWVMCNGQLLPLQQNSSLYAVLGIAYGGDGINTFGLPNLNGAFAIGQGAGQRLTPRTTGQIGGAKSVTLSQPHIPTHNHTVNAVAETGTTGDPLGRTWAQQRYGRAARPAYSAGSDAFMALEAVTAVGGNQPHNNMSPFVGMYFMIALTGNYPARA